MATYLLGFLEMMEFCLHDGQTIQLSQMLLHLMVNREEIFTNRKKVIIANYPYVIKMYKRYMGGTGLIDETIARHRISIRSKNGTGHY